jgi:hypothetical protein
MTEIYEVSAPADRADELLRWLAGHGLSDATASSLFGAAGRGDFASVVGGVLDEGRTAVLSGSDDGT